MIYESAASHSATRRGLGRPGGAGVGDGEGLCRMEGFSGKRGRTRELLKNEYLGGRTPFLGGKRTLKGSPMQSASSFYRDGEGPCDRLPDWCLTRKFQTG